MNRINKTAQNYLILVFWIIVFSCKSQDTLDINQIRAIINFNGSLFTDLRNNKAGFEVPKGSGKKTIFASSLWIGGLDAKGNLHEAAQTYQQHGTDFWAGPLDTATCKTDTAGWQKTWKVNKTTVDSHRVYWYANGYRMPDEIRNWPGNGTNGKNKILAPFVDRNFNGIYEPYKGDYPYIPGDQAVYFIINDTFTSHAESNAPAMGIEVHGMVFAYCKPVHKSYGDSLNKTVFLRLQIKNYSTENYHDVYAGIWTDFDLGFRGDDFIGCDTGRNMYFAYNSDSLDEMPDDPNPGYGLNPPIMAVKFLNTPMTHFTGYQNTSSLTGNPNSSSHFYNYLVSRWHNGQQLRYGGDGFFNIWSNSPVNFAYPSDPRLPKPAWSERSSGNLPGERRCLGSAGPFELKSGDYITLDMAYIFIRHPHADYLDNFDNFVDADKIQFYYNTGLFSDHAPASVEPGTNRPDIMIFPNPMNEFTTIRVTNPLNSNLKLQIMDVSGRLVFESTMTSDEITVSRKNLEPGFYLVRIGNGTYGITKKLIVK